MRRTVLASIGGFLLAACLTTSTWAANTNPGPARPGSVNYLEGQVSIGSQDLTPDSVGSAVLQGGETLNTQNGKAEVLLTPGVFLRVGENSSVKMISPDLANTEVQLDRGRAMVEVADIYKDNNIRVDSNGVSTQVLKNGLYDFDADHNQILVFKGKATVYDGDKKINLGDNRQLTLDGKLKAQDFDAKNYRDDFYRWSSLRSAYLAEENVDAANAYLANNTGWYGTGWYWDPYFGSYTFLPADGILYSPFGWGFYSPLVVYRAPFFYRGPFLHTFGPGYYPYRYGRSFGPIVRPGFLAPGRGPVGGFRGGFHGGGGHR